MQFFAYFVLECCLQVLLLYQQEIKIHSLSQFLAIMERNARLIFSGRFIRRTGKIPNIYKCSGSMVRVQFLRLVSELIPPFLSAIVKYSPSHTIHNVFFKFLVVLKEFLCCFFVVVVVVSIFKLTTMTFHSCTIQCYH